MDYRWDLCERARFNDRAYNHTHELFQLLLKVDAIFQDYDITYTLTHGTLIGVKRNNQMNPYEADVDVRVNYNTRLPVDAFSERGLVLFRDRGTWRVCARRTDGELKRTKWLRSPWSGNCFPFLDIFPSRDFPNEIEWDRMGNANVPVPLNALQELEENYGIHWKEDIPTHAKCCSPLALQWLPSSQCADRSLT